MPKPIKDLTILAVVKVTLVFGKVSVVE